MQNQDHISDAHDSENGNEVAVMSNNRRSATDRNTAMAALALIGVASGGCQDDDLRTFPDTPPPWTESCYRTNGDVVTPWGSEIIRHAVHRAVQADAGRDTDDPDDDEEVTKNILLQRECLFANGIREAGEHRCAGDGTVSASNGIVLHGSDGLEVVVDAARDGDGNQSGFFPGGECRPSTDFDNSRFEFPIVATANWGGEVGFTMSFMWGDADGAGSGVPSSNIPTQEIPSLLDNGSRNWAHEYRADTDNDGEPDEVYEDDWGNELTHAPWMENAFEMVNAEGERLTALRGWCIRPDTHTDVLAEYLNSEGCVVPPQ